MSRSKLPYQRAHSSPPSLLTAHDASDFRPLAPPALVRAEITLNGRLAATVENANKFTQSGNQHAFEDGHLRKQRSPITPNARRPPLSSPQSDAHTTAAQRPLLPKIPYPSMYKIHPSTLFPQFSSKPPSLQFRFPPSLALPTSIIHSHLTPTLIPFMSHQSGPASAGDPLNPPVPTGTRGGRRARGRGGRYKNAVAHLESVTNTTNLTTSTTNDSAPAASTTGTTGGANAHPHATITPIGHQVAPTGSPVGPPSPPVAPVVPQAAPAIPAAPGAPPPPGGPPPGGPPPDAGPAPAAGPANEQTIPRWVLEFQAWLLSLSPNPYASRHPQHLIPRPVGEVGRHWNLQTEIDVQDPFYIPLRNALVPLIVKTGVDPRRTWSEQNPVYTQYAIDMATYLFTLFQDHQRRWGAEEMIKSVFKAMRRSFLSSQTAAAQASSTTNATAGNSAADPIVISNDDHNNNNDGDGEGQEFENFDLGFGAEEEFEVEVYPIQPGPIIASPAPARVSTTLSTIAAPAALLNVQATTTPIVAPPSFVAPVIAPAVITPQVPVAIPPTSVNTLPQSPLARPSTQASPSSVVTDNHPVKITDEVLARALSAAGDDPAGFGTFLLAQGESGVAASTAYWAVRWTDFKKKLESKQAKAAALEAPPDVEMVSDGGDSPLTDMDSDDLPLAPARKAAPKKASKPKATKKGKGKAAVPAPAAEAAGPSEASGSGPAKTTRGRPPKPTSIGLGAPTLPDSSDGGPVRRASGSRSTSRQVSRVRADPIGAGSRPGSRTSNRVKARTASAAATAMDTS